MAHFFLLQINLSYCSVTNVGLLALASIKQLQCMTILHLSGLTPNGLVAALLACRGLTKVKLHTSLSHYFLNLSLNIWKPEAVCFTGGTKHSRYLFSLPFSAHQLHIA